MSGLRRDLPRFIFTGPEKTGTTWLHELLGRHAAIELPLGVKETFFFDRHYDNGLDWYLSHFRREAVEDGTGTERLRVEVAPSYFSNRLAAERIAHDCPGVEIICTLREPISRTASLYRHLHRYGWTRLPFREAVEAFPFLVEGSEYHARLVTWWKLLGETRVHLLFYEDLVSDRTGFLRALENILGVSGLAEFGGLPVANESQMSRSFLLARVTRVVATWLRKHRLYFVIEGLRTLGLKRLIYSGGAGSDVELSETDLAWLRHRLRPDQQRLQARLGTLRPGWESLRLTGPT